MSTPTTASTAKTTAARRPAAGTTTSGAQAAGKAKQTSLEQHLAVLAEGEVLNPAELFAFLESLRALTTGVAFFVHAAGAQLEAAARKAARDNVDGRLTLAQKVDMARTLRRMGKSLNGGVAEDLLMAAKGAVKTYGLFEAFSEGLESDSVSRPHRNGRGGFSLSGN